MKTRYGFPGVLWLLPIFFGVLGGIIAGMISSMKYNASWLELFLVGLILTVMALLFWWFIIYVNLMMY